MAASIESLIFEIITKDRASEGLSKAGMAARDAGVNVDALTKSLKEVGRQTAEARVKLAGNKEALAQLDKIDVKLLSLDRRTTSSKLTVEGAARAVAEIAAVNVELDKLGGKGGTAETATKSVGMGGLGGPAGMGALIGAGVILSPVIATLSVGLGGFALAAYGVIAPIENAAKKTGGLAANLKLLDPEQRTVALGILGLGKQYDAFQKALKPEVLSVFGAGLQLAGHLLHDIQPVAAATGKALGGLLGRIDAEFQSGTWQSFFGFMAKTAGPDVQLLGNVFVSLANDLPMLLTELQPLAEGFLKDTDAILKLINATEQAINWEKLHAASISHSGGALGFLKDRVIDTFKAMFPQLGLTKQLQGALDKMSGSTAAATPKVKGLGGAASASALQVQALAAEVSSLTDAENKAISPLLAYTNAMLTQRDDADKLTAALKKSHDQVGLNTAEQRASFTAANTYIQDLLNTAAAAGKSGQGIGAQITNIRNALPLLQSVKGGTRLYWQEVQSLVGWLHQLQAIKQVSERVVVSGTGTWAKVQGGGTLTGPGFARGAYVTAGSGPAADDVIARVSKGELIVPAHMVSAGMTDHLRGQIPGFAAGGIIGSYAGPVAGLKPWGQHDWAATVAGITAGIAGSMAKQLAAQFSAIPVGNIGSGVGRWVGVVREALGMEGLNQALLLNVMLQMQTESGGNPNAINLWDINARNGDPSRGLMQVIGATFRGFHWPGTSWNIYDPLANVAAALNYARNRYGPTLMSGGMGIGSGHGYDNGGYLPPGLSLAYNGTGRPERVLPPGGGGATYVINVTVAPLARPADVGREIVGAIREHEKRSGNGWRK